MIFEKLGGNAKKAIALAAAASMLMCMQVRADVIIQPGVVIGGNNAPVVENTGDSSTAQETQSPSAQQSSNVILGPGVSVGSDSSEPQSDAGSSGQGAPGESEASASAPTGGADSSTSQTVDYAALSTAQKNTVVSTNEVNIVYINGRKIDMSKPLIALTYDDGPQTSVGNRIMDIMAQYGQKCTFFMVGDRVASRASEVQRMVAEGHEVANHTYGHVYLNKVGADTIRSQVDKCNTVIAQAAGVAPAVMRLPGGNKNSTVLANINMPIILWNIDTRDWATRNAESTKAAVIGKVKSGDIVLMHELYESTADATSVIVPTLAEQGYQMVTVSELAALKNVTLVPNKVYYSF